MKFYNDNIIKNCYECVFWEYGVGTSKRSQHVCGKSKRYFKHSYKGKLFESSWHGQIPDWCELPEYTNDGRYG